MKVFRVVYKSTGLTMTRLMVADSYISAASMAEHHKLSGEEVAALNDISGDLSVYIQEDLRVDTHTAALEGGEL